MISYTIKADRAETSSIQTNGQLQNIVRPLLGAIAGAAAAGACAGDDGIARATVGTATVAALLVLLTVPTGGGGGNGGGRTAASGATPAPASGGGRSVPLGSVDEGAGA